MLGFGTSSQKVAEKLEDACRRHREAAKRPTAGDEPGRAGHANSLRVAKGAGVERRVPHFIENGLFRLYLRKGFVAMYSLVLLLVLATFGFGYWNVSRLSTDQILKEAHRIKARNLAQAGVEKVLINIMNQYQMGNTEMSYPTKFTTSTTQKEYEKDFGDGKYKVESVSIYTPPGTDKRMLGVPYFKNRVQVGQYDVWQIIVVGEIPTTQVSARVETLVKIIRKTVQY